MNPLSSPTPDTEPIARAARATADCVCFNIRKAARLISLRYDAVLKPFGLNAGQFAIIALLGAAPEPLSLGEAARALGMERTTLTRNLRLLDKAGLTRTRFDKNDARTKRLFLTQKGWSVLGSALPTWQRVQARTLSRLNKEGWPVLRQNLDRLGQVIS